MSLLLSRSFVGIQTFMIVFCWYMCIVFECPRVDKKKSPYLRHQSLWNFTCCWYICQRAVAFVVMIWGKCIGAQLWQFSVVIRHWSCLVVWGVTRVWLAQKMSAADIHWQHMEVYVNDLMSRQQVAKWCLTFAFGRDNAMDSNQSG